jgi:hypothetical protein
MPNRILRDWTDSEKMHKISSQSERFFIRLIMKADDFGCFTANPKLLLSALFPLSEDIRPIDVAKWLNECLSVGLVTVYKVDEKMYLQIVEFGQRLRTARSKYPQPHEANSLNPRSIVSESRSDVRNPRPETEAEAETDVEAETEQFADSFFKIIFDEMTLENYKRVYRNIDILDQLEKFKIKVRGAPDDYRTRDTGGMRNAFQYQLGKVKPEKVNGTTNNRGNTQGTVRRADAVIEEGKDFGEF